MAQAVVLSLLRSGTSYDGTEQLLYTQYVDLGYGRSQPPLFTWILIAVQQVFGVSQIAENVLKFACLAAGFGAVWRITLGLGYARGVAAASMLSLFLLAEIGFEAQRNYTHSVLLFALVGWIAVLYLSAMRRGSWGCHIGLGVLFGAVLLTKYNAILLIAALVIADLSVRRAGVFRRAGSLVMWPVAAALIAPHLIWATENADHVFALTGGFIGGFIGGGESVPLLVLRAGAYYVQASAGLMLPLGVVAAAAWWWMREAPTSVVQPDAGRCVFWRWAAVFWVIGLIVALAALATEVRMRWLIPIGVPLVPLMIGGVLSRAPRATVAVTVIGAGFGAVSIAGQWVQSTWINPRTDYAYAQMSDAMQQAGMPMDIVVATYPIFGNLRLYGVDRVLAPVLPDPARIAPDAASAVWQADHPVHEDQIAVFGRALGLCFDLAHPAIAIEMPRRHGDGALSAIIRPLSRAACAQPAAIPGFPLATPKPHQ